MLQETKCTTSSSWLKAIYKTLVKASVNVEHIFASCDIPIEYLFDPNQRIDTDKTWPLWKLAAKYTDNDAFGLDAVNFLMDDDHNALIIAVKSSSNTREAIDRSLRYYRTVSTALTLTASYSHQFIVNVHAPPNQRNNAREAVDSAIGFIFKQYAELGTKPIRPTRIDFMRPEPKNIVAFKSFFQVPLNFNCAQNVLIYPLQTLQIPCKHSNTTLAAHLDKYLMNKMDEVGDLSLSKRAHIELLSMLPFNNLSIQVLAKRLHLGTRTLQRRLRKENINFKVLLTKARIDAAEHYFNEGRYSIGEIGYYLGFSSLSNFVRFFKSHFKQSPSEYLKFLKKNN
jgi:AraC-like DNA-binding protein